MASVREWRFVRDKIGRRSIRRTAQGEPASLGRSPPTPPEPRCRPGEKFSRKREIGPETTHGARKSRLTEAALLPICPDRNLVKRFYQLQTWSSGAEKASERRIESGIPGMSERRCDPAKRRLSSPVLRELSACYWMEIREPCEFHERTPGMRLVPPRIRERVTDRVTRVGDAGHNGAPDAVPQCTAAGGNFGVASVNFFNHYIAIYQLIFFTVETSLRTLIIDASINYNNSHWTSEPQITVCILQWRRHEAPVTQGAPSKLPYSEYSPIKKLFRVTSSLQEWLLNLPPALMESQGRRGLQELKFGTEVAGHAVPAPGADGI
ncbi:hypothetical protein GEV33_006549 [Tenebrio molitor]|uniref:Uncharacterized protein n=1 Tax=Tenebrio molitor TaxID=7067 RepID=A0A8J6HJR3_TENMO|nr:hypothetical protein GEV33_006549 [Tenebrio molitor]